MIDVDALVRITSDDEYKAVMDALIAIVNNCPNPAWDSPAGLRLRRLAFMAEVYEKALYPHLASPVIAEIFDEREMAVIYEFAKQKEMSVAAVLKQALRVYQAVERRAAAGYHVAIKCKLLTPDFGGKCENCEETPIVPMFGMCGPCTFGEADTLGGNWSNIVTKRCHRCDGTCQEVKK